MIKNIRQEEKNTKNSMTPQIIQDIIYNWVNENYGSEEAENPSWDISTLSKHISKMLEVQYTVKKAISVQILTDG